MTPPTALERCPTCDREGCAVAAAAALVASLTIPVTPGENGCACYGEFSRSHNPSRGCEIHGADGSVALEAAWSAERAAREDCHAHRVDWRARAIAAEIRAEEAEAHGAGSDALIDAICQRVGARDTGCGGQTVEAGEMRRRMNMTQRIDMLTTAAAQWAKVAPLIERLRWPKSPHDEEQLVAAIFAATEATP